MWRKMFNLGECLRAVEGCSCLIAGLGEVIRNELRNVEFIFDDQNTFHVM